MLLINIQNRIFDKNLNLLLIHNDNLEPKAKFWDSYVYMMQLFLLFSSINHRYSKKSFWDILTGIIVFPQAWQRGPNKEEQTGQLSGDGLSPLTPEIEFLGLRFGGGEPDADKST